MGHRRGRGIQGGKLEVGRTDGKVMNGECTGVLGKSVGPKLGSSMRRMERDGMYVGVQCLIFYANDDRIVRRDHKWVQGSLLVTVAMFYDVTGNKP